MRGTLMLVAAMIFLIVALAWRLYFESPLWCAAVGWLCR
jgi:hypothetical protein